MINKNSQKVWKKFHLVEQEVVCSAQFRDLKMKNKIFWWTCFNLCRKWRVILKISPKFIRFINCKKSFFLPSTPVFWALAFAAWESCFRAGSSVCRLRDCNPPRDPLDDVSPPVLRSSSSPETFQNVVNKYNRWRINTFCVWKMFSYKLFARFQREHAI